MTTGRARQGETGAGAGVEQGREDAEHAAGRSVVTGDSGSGPGAAHVPVLLDRVIALLDPVASLPGSLVVDATLGLGGHTAELLARFPAVRVLGVDRDAQALSRARERLASYASRLTLVHAVYDQLPEILSEHGVDRVDGVLFDLGVSSLQLDDARRGFSYAQDAPLDMRMD